MLNVTDPSSRRVIRDTLPPGDDIGTLVTDGFRFNVVRFQADGAGALRPMSSLPVARQGLLPLTPLFTWPGWERPTFHRVRKQSFDLLKSCLHSLPD
jgi:hypothetical protein